MSIDGYAKGAHVMDKDKLKGKGRQAAGAAKEQWGKATGDKSQQAKGKGEKAMGKAQEGFGKSKDKTREAERTRE